MQFAGYEASGIELSPWVASYGRDTFGVSVGVGTVETLQAEPASLDSIVMFDVLEHLSDPVSSIRRCLELLKLDGLLLIQTPHFREKTEFETLLGTAHPFLEQLKSSEHLFLFSEGSIREFFRRLSVQYLSFEPAIFAHYDMFVVASRQPLTPHSGEEIERALLATASGRLVLALMDIRERELATQARCKDALTERGPEIARLTNLLHAADADRAAQLQVIEEQGRQLERIRGLEADIAHLKTQLEAAEEDRTARLAVIEEQGGQLGRVRGLEADIAHLKAQLAAAEEDRAARLAVIEEQGRQLERVPSLEADIAHLKAQLGVAEEDRAARLAVIEEQGRRLASAWCRIGIRLKLL
jgi:hypothetical protein